MKQAPLFDSDYYIKDLLQFLSQPSVKPKEEKHETIMIKKFINLKPKQ